MKTKYKIIAILVTISLLLSSCSMAQANVYNAQEEYSEDVILLSGYEDDEEVSHLYYKTLCEGENTATEVYIIDSGVPGPNIAIVGGTHGNEVAGWMAAEIMLSYEPDCGKLMIIPRANVKAVKAETRTSHLGLNLNRSYTGVDKEDANKLELLAWEILEVIEEFDPVVVIDNHESRAFSSQSYSFGNTIIFSYAGDNAFTAAEIVEEINLLNLGEDEPFSFIGPATETSLNDYVANNMDILIFTIETTRVIPLDTRINQQIQIAKIILKKFGMATSDKEWIVEQED